jgi:hypothetical protein
VICAEARAPHVAQHSKSATVNGRMHFMND